jgi:hypothetical protein
MWMSKKFGCEQKMESERERLRSLLAIVRL